VGVIKNNANAGAGSSLEPASLELERTCLHLLSDRHGTRRNCEEILIIGSVGSFAEICSQLLFFSTEGSPCTTTFIKGAPFDGEEEVDFTFSLIPSNLENFLLQWDCYANLRSVDYTLGEVFQSDKSIERLL
jgi:hypothetical protein